MATLQDISVEIRGRLEEIEGTKADKRETLMRDLIGTYQLAETSQAMTLAVSPHAGLEFAHVVNKSLGAVNEVLFNEFDIEPVHIKELNLVTVDTLEELLGDDIDSILEKIEG